jgi:hypothetical protein
MGRIIAFACFAATACGAAVAQPPAGPAEQPRTVQLELRQGGRLLGTPSVTLVPGRSAALSVGGVYALRLRLDRAANAASAAYLVRSTLYRADGGGAPVATPAVTLAQGEQARLRIAAGDGAPILFAVLVQ